MLPDVGRSLHRRRSEFPGLVYSTSEEGARLVYSIYASDYVGLLLTCVAGAPEIAVSRPAPEDATREIILAVGAERRVLPAERHGPGTKARRALYIALYAGQRRSDAVLMGKHDREGNRIRVRQEKTGAFPVHPAAPCPCGRAGCHARGETCSTS